MSLADGIIVKSPAEIALMRQAGRILSTALKTVVSQVKPGVNTRELDTLMARELARLGAAPSFLGYRGYPAVICASVNDEIVHGIPGDRVLKDGDIISLDVGDIYQGFQADMAVTVAVGKISVRSQKLMDVTRGALEAGVKEARGGRRLGDVSAAIQKYVESRGFAVVREYSGHGIGRALHEEPQVANFGTAGQGPLLRPGMALAIEPMVTAGDWRTKIAANHWTVSTVDGSLAAHFEHTIAITESAAEVLTEN